MNIRQRIILLVAAAFFALTGIGSFAVLQARSSANEVKTVTEGVVPSASKSVALMSQLKDVQISTLSMVRETDADAIERARKLLADRQGELQRALDDQLVSADSPAQTGLVKLAQEGLKAYFASIDDTAKFKLAGQTEMAEANLGATVDQYLREQGEMLHTLQIEKNRSKDEAITGLNEHLDRTKATLTLITIGSVLGLCTIGVLLYRQIVLPIGAMERKMSEIASKQDFTQRLPIDRKDEIGKSMLAFNTMIERIQQSAELVAQKTADIHAMLHSIPQGILTIEAGGRIHPEYSDHLRMILESDEIGGRDVNAVVFSGTGLGSDALSQVDAAIAACIGEDEMNFEFNAHLLPTEIEKAMAGGGSKILDLHWSPMTDGSGTITRLLLCLRDVTELRALARAANAQKRELALIGEILAVQQEKFQAFVDDAVQFIGQNATLIGRGAAGDAAERLSTVDLLFRNMHTIKGNARTHGLLQLANVVHRIEETYDALRKGSLAWDTPQLESELNEARLAVHEYARINEDKLGRRGPGRRGSVDMFVLVPKEQVQRLAHALDNIDARNTDTVEEALHEARQAIARIGTERLEDALSGVIESLPALAAELGKPAPALTIRDDGVAVRNQIAGTLRNAFMHLLRNSLDHGIETAAARQALGKPAAGRIALAASLDDKALHLALHDDGRGLDLLRIRDKALAAALIGAGDSLSPAQTAALIFRPGFSTAEQVTDVSGRGVGMDAVKAFVESEGGQIAIELVGEPRADGCHAFRTVITLPARFGLRVAETKPAEVQHV